MLTAEKLVKSNEGLTVDNLIKACEKLTLEEKKHLIDVWCEEYFRKFGKQPKSYDLTRLADVLLSDELKNPSRSKVQKTKYPILSKQQLTRRQREMSMESELVDNLHRKKINNQPTRKKDAKRNEY